MAEYRKIYEKCLGIKIEKNFDIHHIDGNKNNNTIFNLVALPKKLHQKYHALKNKLNNKYELKIELQSLCEPGFGINEFILTQQIPTIKEFIETWYQCCNYLDIRNERIKELWQEKGCST